MDRWRWFLRESARLGRLARRLRGGRRAARGRAAGLIARLGGVQPGQVVVLGSAETRDLAGMLARCLPSARILLVGLGVGTRRSTDPANLSVHAASGLKQIRRAVLRCPAPDLIVDTDDAAAYARSDAFKGFFLLLGNGGRYAVERTTPPIGPAEDADESVVELIDRLAALSADLADGKKPVADRDDLERARSIAARIDHSDWSLLTKQGNHLVKLRDAEATAVLGKRLGPSWGEEVLTRPGRRVVSKARLHVNQPTVPHQFRDWWDVPDLRLRVYRDAICTRRQLVIVGDLIAPISFHHPLARRLHNRDCHDAGRHVARPRPDITRLTHLDGTFYHLASEFPGHFGHFMTEDLARLWGWDAARQRYPDLRLLVGAPPDAGPPAYARTMLAAFGIAPEDVVCFEDPVQVERLVGVSPQYHNGRYIDPDLELTWARIGSRLMDPPVGGPERVFVSRPPGSTRRCRNAAELEAVFADHGFAIVLPERLNSRDQARMFGTATVTAGYGGSGQFNAIFAPHPATRIVIAAETYYASNEWLISSLKGDRYFHFWCPSEAPARKSGWDPKAFHSGFGFDFDRDGEALQKVLSALPG